MKEMPWNRVHLSKKVRRGKTPEEIQRLRKEKWEKICRTKKEFLPGEILGFKIGKDD